MCQVIPRHLDIARRWPAPGGPLDRVHEAGQPGGAVVRQAAPVIHNSALGSLWIVNVYEAVHSRRSVRGFLDRPVPAAVLARVIGAALRAPRNWECFGAPAALFCYLDEQMLPPQWMDAGIFLQSIMLLLRAEALDSCPQIGSF
jgi:hypothetical protein